MNVGLYHTVAAMRSNQQRVEIVASNIANAETTGFKRMLHVAHGSVGRGPKHEQVVTGSVLDLQQGIFEHTGQDYDFALEGEGFFLVDGPDGEIMTRDGRFEVSTDGVLLTMDGNPVAWEGARGRIDPVLGAVKVSAAGEVLQRGQPVGRLRIVAVESVDDIEVDSQGRYRLRSGKEFVPTDTSVQQGVLERANVQTVDELVEMIAAQRSFEMAAQTFRLISESYQRLHR